MAIFGFNRDRAAASNDERPPEHEETALLLGGRPEQSSPTPFTQPVSVIRMAVYALYFIMIELGQSLPGNAFHQVVEESLCRDMHSRTDAKFCGADNDVQSALAVLFAWHGTAKLLPGLLTAIPYALLADRYKQKPFIVLNAFGMALVAAGDRVICYWPDKISIYSLWIAGLLCFVGGGFQVSNALLFANITGLTTDAARPSVMSLMVALSYGPRLIATMVAPEMIGRYGPWPLLWISLGFAIFGVFLALFFIEPVHKPKVSTDAMASESDAGSPEENPTHSGKDQLTARVLKSFQETTAGLSYLLNRCDFTVIRFVICLLMLTFAWRTNELSAQIMRKKFGWNWAKLSYLTALEVSLSLISSIALLPAGSYIMSTKLSMGTMTRDMAVARLCGFTFVIGAALVVSASTDVIVLIGVGIWTLGTVYNLVLRNLLVLTVGETPVVLFSCINTVETIGNLVMAPFIAQMFKFGLHLGGVWVTLPVMIGGSFSVLALLLLGLKTS